jgi:hypothetical protein
MATVATIIGTISLALTVAYPLVLWLVAVWRKRRKQR